MSNTHQFQTEVRQLLDIVIHAFYSDREVFVRELVSNASDALEKLRLKQLTNTTIHDPQRELRITITTDKDAVSYQIKEVGARMKGNTSRTSFYNEDEGIYNYIHFKFDFQETFDDEEYYGSDCKVWETDALRKERKNRTFAGMEKLEMREPSAGSSASACSVIF